ncbi:ThiF family adenylyltransferase [Bradyrhizobium sp. AUGA SZCCT0176]|uniref:ThiF family adenylyltransferase n=1 Tax=Bradyrhizobium sp. AUGA SZCCT0176 TaxID=2807664 RepID=UPI001BA7DFD7|nr:ThiF family adenylyltransferase [Bradyrhizobium sp. AUGA SZCCT0176]MBR1225233.1 ThiF family adenylyltransferase [Bradyrhizobium sp. AUGA SZCCT0176]
MFQKLVSHNEDIRQLVDKGYAVGFDSNYLIVRDILYLDDKLEQRVGAIVTKLVFTDPDHVVQEDHQIFFAGSHPHNTDGSPIANLGGGATKLALSEAAADVVVQRQFSNKPRVNGQLVPFTDFFAKIESYVGIISGPAIARHGGRVLTFRSVEKVADDSVFKIHDTLTSRAEITDLAAKFKNEIVAVIGLGGTGGYLLDFLVKTPVKEIRGFDVDPLQVHNAFRSPGRFDDAEFKRSKAEVYQARYENFRHGLKLTAKFVDASCVDDLEGVTFAFVCVDKGSSRAGIFDLLIAKKIPFIDVGMGLSRRNGPISGMMRATYYSDQQAQQVRDMALAPLADKPDDVYKTNIQISELNALNAAIAMIRYKQLKGFYVEDDPGSLNFIFGLSDCKMIIRSGSE